MHNILLHKSFLGQWFTDLKRFVHLIGGLDGVLALPLGDDVGSLLAELLQSE